MDNGVMLTALVIIPLLGGVGLALSAWGGRRAGRVLNVVAALLALALFVCAAWTAIGWVWPALVR